MDWLEAAETARRALLDAADRLAHSSSAESDAQPHGEAEHTQSERNVHEALPQTASFELEAPGAAPAGLRARLAQQHEACPPTDPVTVLHELAAKSPVTPRSGYRLRCEWRAVHDPTYVQITKVSSALAETWLKACACTA